MLLVSPDAAVGEGIGAGTPPLAVSTSVLSSLSPRIQARNEPSLEFVTDSDACDWLVVGIPVFDTVALVLRPLVEADEPRPGSDPADLHEFLIQVHCRTNA